MHNSFPNPSGTPPLPPQAQPFAQAQTLAQGDSLVPLFRQALQLLSRWRYVILGSVVASVLIGLVFTLLTTPHYTASSTIEISRVADKVTDLQGVEREAAVTDQEFYQTQYGLLQSRSLSEHVAVQLKLTESPDFFEMFDYESPDPAFRLIDGRYPPSGRATRQIVAGEILRAHLQISPTRMSRLVEIRFTSPDPAFSAKIANVWASHFIETNLQRKIEATSYGRNLLQGQLAQLKARLDESQRQLVQYASQAEIINLPPASGAGDSGAERSIVVDNLSALNQALNQATAKRIEAQARYEQSQQGGVSMEALNNTAISTLRQRRAELAASYAKMMAQFEPTYPAAEALQVQIAQIDRSLKNEEARVLASLKVDYLQHREQETALQRKVDALKAAYLDQRERSIQYNIYQQDVDTNQALYDGLLQRFKEIGVAGDVGVNNVSIVDLAQKPRRPSSPNLPVNLAIALFAGLGLGAVLALVLQQMDEGVTDPAQAKRELGLPVLGSIPKVEDAPKENLLDRKSDLFDAYLTVQTNLALSTEYGVPRTFSVTSTRPSEGKSTTSLSLATTLSRSGKRVILIDGDMRNPSVHHLGGVHHDRGLSNFLAGDNAIETLTFEMASLGFTAMSAGPLPPNAAELLSTNRLSVLLERLQESYDHIIIDSPPVMGLADAALIGAKVEGIIYAVESHNLRLGLIREALERLRTANVRLIGCVMTKFDAKKAHYGYGKGYEYGYQYGRKPKADAA